MKTHLRGCFLEFSIDLSDVNNEWGYSTYQYIIPGVIASDRVISRLVNMFTLRPGSSSLLNLSSHTSYGCKCITSHEAYAYAIDYYEQLRHCTVEQADLFG
ncbi:hypothetical protein C5167_029344 [Papaver somniferum]|nr:hypothetical protein C5167_029344 [Papaver somniferum]